MNKKKFSLNLRKFYLISIITVLTAASLNSQQSSFVQNNHVFSINRYTFPTHLGIEKTYSISQNNLGIVFFSTNKGIITFDGQDWGVVNFPKKSLLSFFGGKLYLFSENFTGEISKDASGSYSVKEIKVSYPSGKWDPAAAASSMDAIYLLVNQKLWSFTNNTFEPISQIAKEGYLFSDGENIYIKNQNSVSSIKSRKLSPFNGTRLNETHRYFTCKTFFPVYFKYPNLVFTSKGKNTEEISLPLNENVVTTYADNNNNLWVLSDCALWAIKYANYFNYAATFSDLRKPLAGIAKNSNGYFLAEKNKVFSTSYREPKTLGEEVIKVLSLDTIILVTTKKGVYQLVENRFIPLVKKPVTYITKYKDKVLFVSRGTIFSLRFYQKTPSVKELFNLNADSVQKITCRLNGDILVLDHKNKIHQIKNNKTGYSIETLYSSSKEESPKLNNLFLLENEIYVCNSFNIYKLNGNTLVSQEKSAINFPSQGNFSDYLEDDTTGGVIYSTGKPGETKHIYYGKNIEGSRVNWLEIPIWEAGLKNPAILSCDGKEALLFEDGKLFHLNLDKFFSRSDKVIITTREVTVNNQVTSVHDRKKGRQYVPYFETNYPVNLLSMKFYASDLTYPEHVQYSFLLKDKDAEWSPWARLPEKNFSNLPPGDYILLVKAQTLNGSVSDTLRLQFKIKPPFYLQWYAFLIYILLFSGITGMIWIRRKKQFEEEKVKLEKIIQERTAELIREKEKTDDLLANMLPKDTAEELKSTGKATSHKFDMVTVLFSDIQGFTKIAEQMNPEKLIDQLDNFFFQFDSVVEKYNIEKIKTIGDAYMAAGGIPYKNRTNPVEVVLAALEMQEYMKTLKSKNSDIWDLRIGVHTGAVIAGVIGHKRISYDIWGDTVNTASRMESSGQPGKINISGHTYELVKEFFICEYRGKMPVKYKGDIDMYFVKGIRPELSVNMRSIPNKKFFIQLQLLRILDLEEFVFNKMEAELPKQLTFHNLKHTKDVYTQAELLGRAENISADEMLMLRTAALFHDMGFIRAFHNHELKSIEYCREILPRFKYSNEQINSICSLILSTQKNSRPQNKLEEILNDATNDYFGRIDFITMLNNFIKEVRLYSNKNSEEIIAEQLNSLENHDYYTLTARKLREVPKYEQIQKVKELPRQLV